MMKIIKVYGWLIVKVAVFPFISVDFQDNSLRSARAGLFVFNHRSASDPFIIGLLKTTCVQTVNGWPMRLPFFGFFAKKGGYIDITNLASEELLEQVKALVAQGVSVVTFPEGTRSGSKQMNQFKSGMFRVAKELNMPIYPGCIVGNENIPNRKMRFRSGRIKVRILPEVENSVNSSAFSLKRKVHDCIAQEIEKLENETNSTII